MFLIPLNEREYRSGNYSTHLGAFGFMDDFEEVASCGANILEYTEAGSCIYLRDNKCSIHPSRPQACRAFSCQSTDPAFSQMINHQLFSA